MENRKALKVFYNNLAIDYTDFVIYYSTNPLNFARIATILRMLALNPGDKVCDVGCGDGYILNQAKKITPTVQGIDISEVRTRRTCSRGISATLADAGCIPFKAGQFDKVICSEVIEHVINPEAVLSEISRILKPDGKVVLTVPLAQEITRTITEVPDYALETMDWKHISKIFELNTTHLNSFTEQSIKELVESCGLTVNGIAFTWHHRLRSGLAFWGVYKVWRYLIMELGEGITLIPWSDKAIRLISSILFKKEPDIKHHIIVRGVKQENEAEYDECGDRIRKLSEDDPREDR